MKSDLNHLLTLLAGGDNTVLDQVLELLSRETLYIPFRLKSETPEGRVIFTVPIWVSPRRKVLPAFRVESDFIAWSKGEHECLPVDACDLALLLPEKTSLVLDPDRLSSIELSPESFKRVLTFEPEVRRTGLIHKRAEDSALGKQQGVHDELRRIFRHYPEVLEAVYREPDQQYSGGLLGLITEAMDPERRFFLMTEIGQLSRSLFGAVGAIEVFDDQQMRKATQWGLLSGVRSLYSQRGTERMDSVPKEEELQTPLPEEVFEPPPAVIGGRVFGQKRQSGSSVRGKKKH